MNPTCFSFGPCHVFATPVYQKTHSFHIFQTRDRERYHFKYYLSTRPRQSVCLYNRVPISYDSVVLR